MSLEEKLAEPKVSKGAVICIVLLYLVLEVIVELASMLPQLFTNVLGMVKENPTMVPQEQLFDHILANYGIPWYQNVLKILVIWLILYLLKKQHVNFFTKVKLTYHNWLEIISLSVALVALNFGLDWLIVKFQPGFNTGNEALLNVIEANTSVITMVIAVGLIAPVIEEVIMRGVFIGVLFKEKKYLGLLISSVIFAFLHSPTDLLSFMTYFVPGLMLGLLYIKTKWLGAPIIAHMLNNLLSFL